MKQVTIIWTRGGINIYLNVTQVHTEYVQWKLELSNGSTLLIPMCNVKTLLIADNGED